MFKTSKIYVEKIKVINIIKFEEKFLTIKIKLSTIKYEVINIKLLRTYINSHICIF